MVIFVMKLASTKLESREAYLKKYEKKSVSGFEVMDILFF